MEEQNVNMVNVECPSCAETIDLGPDALGTYECPCCQQDFEYEPMRDNGTWTVIGVFFLIFTAAFFALMFSYIEDSDWEETEGEILSRDGSIEWDIGYKYTFTVNGESFNGSDGCSSDGGQSNCGGYDPGDAVMISYNPGNPNQNEMVDNQVGMVLICFFSIPILVMGLLLYGRIRHGDNFSEGGGYDRLS